MELYRPTLCCIDLDQLQKNMDILAARLSGQRLMAVIKGDAYGHGAVPVMKHLLANGIRDFAVATLNEGLALRSQIEAGDILIFPSRKAPCTLRMPSVTSFLAGITVNLPCRQMHSMKDAADGSTITAVTFFLSARASSTL